MPALRPPPNGSAPPSAMDHPLLAAVIGTLPASGPWPAAEREAWFTLMRNAANVAYGMVDTSQPNGASLQPPPLTKWQTPEAAKLYVIKENGQAHCDGVPMAFKDLPANCVMHDKRVLARADDAFVWSSILWTDTGATPPDYPQPPGIQIVPHAGGPKLRAVAAEGDEGGAFT